MNAKKKSRADAARENGKLGGRPPKIAKPKTVALVLSAELLGAIDQHAARLGVNRSEAIRHLVRSALAPRSAPDPPGAAGQPDDTPH